MPRKIVATVELLLTIETESDDDAYDIVENFLYDVKDQTGNSYIENISVDEILIHEDEYDENDDEDYKEDDYDDYDDYEDYNDEE